MWKKPVAAPWVFLPSYFQPELECLAAPRQLALVLHNLSVHTVGGHVLRGDPAL